MKAHRKSVGLFLLSIIVIFMLGIVTWGLLGSSVYGETYVKPTSDKQSASTTTCAMPELAQELALRVDRDQKARLDMMRHMRGSADVNDKKNAKRITKLASVDQANQDWLKPLIKEHGWLGQTLVGGQGAQNAWLLVQHADKDREFQKQCLMLMQAMPTGEVSQRNIAYLTDRILCAEGKPQRYGTQCTIEEGKVILNLVEDRKNLNQRRTEVGLPSIEKYIAQVEKIYVISKSNEDD